MKTFSKLSEPATQQLYLLEYRLIKVSAEQRTHSTQRWCSQCILRRCDRMRWNSQSGIGRTSLHYERPHTATKPDARKQITFKHRAKLFLTMWNETKIAHIIVFQLLVPPNRAISENWYSAP